MPKVQKSTATLCPNCNTAFLNADGMCEYCLGEGKSVWVPPKLILCPFCRMRFVIEGEFCSCGIKPERPEYSDDVFTTATEDVKSTDRVRSKTKRARMRSDRVSGKDKVDD